MADTSAPGDLEHVQDFINTLDLLPDAQDDLTDPSVLASWLSERGLLDPDTRLTDDDLARARAVREALRALCVANAGGEADDGALQQIQAAADGAALRLRLDAGQ